MMVGGSVDPDVRDRVIVECPREEFVPGRLGERFRGGAKAVVLEDPRATDIWQRLLGPQALAASAGNGSSFPWDSSFPRMVRNHLAGNIDAGDMLRFIPGGIGYIARKIILFPTEDGSIDTQPVHFSHIAMPQELLRLVWELMTDILHSTFPARDSLPPYVVTIEVLNYPFSFDEVEQVAALLSDASGGFTKLGLRMDTWKVQAAGLFAIRYLRECLAVASLIPGLHELLDTLNRQMILFSDQQVPEGARIVGDPHYDGTKIVTALLSERETLTTEIHTGKQWVKLPLSTDRLAIFPSQQIDPGLGIHPTFHRILIQEHPPMEPPVKRNITLCLTALPRR